MEASMNNEISLQNKINKLEDDLILANNEIQRLRISIDTILNSPIDDIRTKYFELEEQNEQLGKIVREYNDIRNKFPFLVDEPFYYIKGIRIRKAIVCKMDRLGVYDSSNDYHNKLNIYKSPDTLKDALIVEE